MTMKAMKEKAGVHMSSDLAEKLKAAMEDDNKQAAFYEEFLNGQVFVPVWDNAENTIDVTAEGTQTFAPVIVEDEGIHCLMIFDDEARLADWAEDDIACIAMTGVSILEIFKSQFHWCLNVGDEFVKVFKPEEIDWLAAHVNAAGEA